VVLATAICESLHQTYPNAHIDFLVRKGNEGLLEHHPFLRQVLVWNKKQAKWKNLLRILMQIRRTNYDVVINAHRFASSGFLTAFSGAKIRSGYNKNPLSWWFTHKFTHSIERGVHEIDRNYSLLAPLHTKKALPRIYPSKAFNYAFIENENYITISPASVWFTKQWPIDKWVGLINNLPSGIAVCLMGGATDRELCEKILAKTGMHRVLNLAGKLNFLDSAAVMQKAQMNFSNDSAPLHMAGAVGAPVTAVFCSTIPDFGFAPFDPNGRIVETSEKLSCRPCGLHGLRACPERHFKCATTIDEKLLAQWIT
jgi:heptosyltransferase-2